MGGGGPPNPLTRVFDTRKAPMMYHSCTTFQKPTTALQMCLYLAQWFKGQDQICFGWDKNVIWMEYVGYNYGGIGKFCTAFCLVSDISWWENTIQYVVNNNNKNSNQPFISKRIALSLTTLKFLSKYKLVYTWVKVQNFQNPELSKNSNFKTYSMPTKYSQFPV